MDGKSNEDSLDKSLQLKCVVDDSKMEIVGVLQNECSSSASASAMLMASAMTEAATSSVSVAISPQELRKTDTSSSDDSATITAINTSNSSSSDNGLSVSPDSTPPPCGSNFEKKVKQISKDLKETTLADEDLSLPTHNVGASTITTSSASSSSSSSSSSSGSSTLSTTPEDEETIMLPREDDENTLAGDRSECFAAESLDASHMDQGHSDNVDERSKKVRFHPDAKANDGGNRVKKKRFKTKATNIDGAASGAGATSEECSMDLDEDDDDNEEGDDEDYDEDGMDTDGDINLEDGREDYEEEEEFNLERTIAQAEDYLKQHPLTFVSPNELTGERLQNGLLNIEDMPHFGDSSEDEDLYESVVPENNVQRVLGKQIKGGKVEFLLRYSDRPGLFWEPEEFIQQKCPGMLILYERHREHQQERLMRHVAKRQNLRQRYTDF